MLTTWTPIANSREVRFVNAGTVYGIRLMTCTIGDTNCKATTCQLLEVAGSDRSHAEGTFCLHTCRAAKYIEHSIGSSSSQQRSDRAQGSCFQPVLSAVVPAGTDGAVAQIRARAGCSVAEKLCRMHTAYLTQTDLRPATVVVLLHTSGICAK